MASQDAVLLTGHSNEDVDPMSRTRRSESRNDFDAADREPEGISSSYVVGSARDIRHNMTNDQFEEEKRLSAQFAQGQ